MHQLRSQTQINDCYKEIQQVIGWEPELLWPFVLWVSETNSSEWRALAPLSVSSKDHTPELPFGLPSAQDVTISEEITISVREYPIPPGLFSSYYPWHTFYWFISERLCSSWWWQCVFLEKLSQGTGNPVVAVGVPGMISVPWVSFFPHLAV